MASLPWRLLLVPVQSLPPSIHLGFRAMATITRYSFSRLLVILSFCSITCIATAAQNATALARPSLPSGYRSTNSSSTSTRGYNDTLTYARPLPKNTTRYYRPLYEPHYNSTPIYLNVTGKTVNPLVLAHQDAKPLPIQPTTPKSPFSKRDLPTGTCAPGIPCTNGACCSNVSSTSPRVREQNDTNLLPDGNMWLLA